MYRNYFYKEDLKVELTQLEEEDEKERFLEGSKHKRLIPGYVALEVKENTCKISPVLYPEFRGKGYWKDAENFCWKESLKKDFSQKKTEDVFLTGSTGWRSYCIRNPEILPGGICRKWRAKTCAGR